MKSGPPGLWAIGMFALACAGIALALWRLDSGTQGVRIEAISIGSIPARLHRPAVGEPTAAVVVAHGFAGSQQLMQAYALELARHGYAAITFDFAGHGRNPQPLAGSIVEESGATRHLMRETLAVLDAAAAIANGRLALIGHSMASDIVVRAAREEPRVAATVAISMFSPAVTLSEPRNLLIIVGAWEPGLRDEALRAVALAAGEAVREGVTYGDVSAGTGRRAVFADGVEHVGVLYSREGISEAILWLDAAFGVTRAAPPAISPRGPYILLLLAGIVLVAWPLSRLLPRVASRPSGAGLPWRRLWPVLLVPTLATPLLLSVLPTRFLPVLVADYLAIHFLAYGLIAALCLAVFGGFRGRVADGGGHERTGGLRFIMATIACLSFAFIGFALPLDAYVTSFLPHADRAWLILIMLAGTLPFFLADEWATRGEGAGRLAYPAAKAAFILSLALAVALDFERLFFLIIIVPVIAAFLIVFGMISGWIARATNHPAIGGLTNAAVFAWALGVTFPLLAG